MKTINIESSHDGHEIHCKICGTKNIGIKGEIKECIHFLYAHITELDEPLYVNDNFDKDFNIEINEEDIIETLEKNLDDKYITYIFTEPMPTSTTLICVYKYFS